jgi:glycerate kinase
VQWRIRKQMMRIGIATNAFKGSLTATAAAQAIADGLHRSRLGSECETILMPLADGGDGTLEAMLTQPGSQRRTVRVENALGEPVDADYGLLPDGETAVIEMALASGLAQLKGRLDPMRASTYGTGQLIRDAVEHGAKRLIVGVGGSATTDGGAGCLQALGVELLDAENRPIGRGGGSLHALRKVGTAFDKAEISVLCDVDNPPLGERGAAAIFSPQKGASPQEIAVLEENLSHYFSVIAEQTGRDVRPLSGGGAAGALAGGLAAMANARLVPGAQTLIETLGYRELIFTCDLIITGEGQLDTQTLGGKAPAVIALEASKHGLPAIALAGAVPTDAEAIEQSPFLAAFSLTPHPASLEECLANAAQWLTQLAAQVGNLIYLANGFTQKRR